MLLMPARQALLLNRLSCGPVRAMSAFRRANRTGRLTNVRRLTMRRIITARAHSFGRRSGWAKSDEKKSARIFARFAAWPPRSPDGVMDVMDLPVCQLAAIFFRAQDRRGR